MADYIRLPTGRDIPLWLKVVAREIERFFNAKQPDLTAYTVATLPDPTLVLGRMIFVTDEAGGSVPAFSDGTNWRRVTDRAVVS